MSKFSRNSEERLRSCHPFLQLLFRTVVEEFDCSILEGHRGEEKQNEYFNTKRSKLRWPQSKHNKVPSLAVDAAPYPLSWDDTDRFYYFGGFVKGIAYKLGIPLRWGGDWDNDTQVFDERFKDLVHFELVLKED